VEDIMFPYQAPLFVRVDPVAWKHLGNLCTLVTSVLYSEGVVMTTCEMKWQINRKE